MSVLLTVNQKEKTMDIELRKEKILEKLDDFKKNGVRTTTKTSMQEICNFQDLIGTANYKEIFEIYESLTQEQRRTFIWVCTCTLSPESCEEIIKQTTIRIQRKKLYEECDLYVEDQMKSVNKRELEIREKESVFDACRKSYWKRLNQLKKENTKLKNENEQYKQANEDMYQTNKTLGYYIRQLKDDVSKFHALKDLLKTIKE